MDTKQQEFEQIYMECRPMLIRMAARYGVPKDEVEDIIQEVFLSFYKSYFGDVKANENRPLLGKCLRNASVDYFRKMNRKKITYLDQEALQCQREAKVEKVATDVLHTVIEKEKTQHVLKIVNGMREDWKKILLLNAFHGISLREISEMLGISHASCRMILCRGRKYINEKLQEQGYLEDN